MVRNNVKYDLLPASESALRLLAFDLDGTLVDSAPAIVETVNQVLREHQLDLVPYPVMSALIGLPLEIFWSTFTPLPPSALTTSLPIVPLAPVTRIMTFSHQERSRPAPPGA